MCKYMIFEIGNEDPIIYTEEEILKEYEHFLTTDNKTELIKKWQETFKAIKICDRKCNLGRF